MHNLIDGKKISAQIREELAIEVKEIFNKHKSKPTLAVILVGNDPASEIYVANKARASKSIGMQSVEYRLSSQVSETELIAKINQLNNDKDIHGILVQLPLPKHINTTKVIWAVDFKKDVDGFNVINVGRLSVGDKDEFAGIIPCTPSGCLHLIKSSLGDNLIGLKALVIGASNIVGRPVARLLMLEKCTVTIANSKTKNLKAECLQADIIVSATGVANLITADMVNENTTIIDVGINRIQDRDGKSRLVGDVDFQNVQPKAKFITPVPGGVGPMTIAYLLKNTIAAYKKISNIV